MWYPRIGFSILVSIGDDHSVRAYYSIFHSQLPCFRNAERDWKEHLEITVQAGYDGAEPSQKECICSDQILHRIWDPAERVCRGDRWANFMLQWNPSGSRARGSLERVCNIVSLSGCSVSDPVCNARIYGYNRKSVTFATEARLHCHQPALHYVPLNPTLAVNHISAGWDPLTGTFLTACSF